MLLALFCGFASAQDSSDVWGLWLTHDGRARVEISDCGDGTPCGRIVWMDRAHPENAADTRNPDPALRTRSILGLTMIHGFQRENDCWRRGEIYDPTTGRTYAGALRLMADGRLELNGCVGPFCRAHYWRRID